MLARVLLLSLGVAVTFGCGASTNELEDEGEITSATGALTVHGAAVRSCSTATVRGLSEQLVAELACLRPDALAPLPAMDNVTLEPEVFPYLQPAAAKALEAAAKAYGKPMTINSALRTLPQQYMLRRWSIRDRCGVAVAARVGESNHESGLSIDVDLGTSAANKAVRTALVRESFAWLGANDPVHYDFTGASQDIAGVSVLAFKRLWNRNHPEAPLPLSDAYDAATEAKLRSSPAEGFPTGARCDP